MATPPGSKHERKIDNEQDLKDTMDREINLDIADSLLQTLRKQEDGPAKPLVLSSYNNKGGVLKTTTCVEVGFALAEMGFNILLVDLDSQGSLTKSLLYLEDPEKEITFSKRIRVGGPNGDRLPVEDDNGLPIIREVLNGLTEIVNPEDTDTMPKKLTPVLIQEQGQPEFLNPDPSMRESNPTLMKKFEKRRFDKACKIQHIISKKRGKAQGSVHLVIGHHNTSQISNRIAVANQFENDASYQRIHGSVNWLIRQAAQDVKADIVMVDLNPDSSQLNQCVIMQSDYLLLSTWPDPDGIECMVDLNCRLIQGLRSQKDDNYDSQDEYYMKNRQAWIQMQQDLYHRTRERIKDVNAHLRVGPNMPTLLGVAVHSKEPYRHLRESEQILSDKIFKKYRTLQEDLQENVWVFVKHGSIHTIRKLTARSGTSGGGCEMTINHPKAQHCLGGIWNHQTLKSLSKSLRKPIANINIRDLAGREPSEEEVILKEEYSSKNIDDAMMHIAEHRIRMHRIARAILHNISLSLTQIRPEFRHDWTSPELLTVD
ncbi:hypothetical protein GUITHDRAFT_137416 [Guillardia theta CCMP2712]|uniref:CobQ/CobB/MinD/ParA nucleotide binding domain-containing protein n=1 Tax=Guillardia theta (strain CCMP2712) TaxID=905079 RepID=L1JH45_GUITC|nr:hypothetical protein GUITHDRAFT_137416 [Guillardia theta CCMP2712]EKX47657.1 hypothetical protein GUITHDRAFT_137416 [Guillardia theta CCMP2712]|eukprot:XP_005834637.1 hypothetical protein GUITHDRAFT_137416 [Guillardia theta CCMP2712]